MKHFYITNLFFIVYFFNSAVAQDEFITTWQTTATDETITIPTTGSGYNYTVDWGDGTIETGFTEDASHEYAVADTYTVKIAGDFPRIFFNDRGNKNKILTVEQWGAIAWQSMAQAFNGCANLQLNATDTPDLSAVVSTRRMFAKNTNFEDLQNIIGTWDTGNVEDMNGMFIQSGFNHDIGNWDVSKVRNFDGMFYVCPNFDQDLGNWDISEAVTMRSFITTNSLATNNFSLENYDKTLKGWATLDVGETRIPRDVYVSIDLTRYCEAYVERFQLINDYDWRISDLGVGCPEGEKFITTWQTTTANETITIPTFGGESYSYIIEWGDNTAEAVTTDISPSHTYLNARTYTVKITGDFPRIYFNNVGDKTKIRTIEQWGITSWTSMESAFKGCTFLEIDATDTPDLSDVTSMASMFENGACVDNGGNIGNWNVRTISSMNSMFRNAVMEENINTWNVGSLKTIDYMFASCEDFNQPLDQWNTVNLESAIETFADAKSFDQSLGDWNISNVSDFTNIFTNGTGLSDDNYDKTLIGWATLENGESLSSDVSFGAGNLKYCLGEPARSLLISPTYNWTITDGGLASACLSTDFFITTWQTTTANESITIPTFGSGYQYNIDWGDGMVEFGLTGNVTHEYATAGTYTVRINGDFPRIYFNNTGDKDKIRTIEQWGTISWSSMASAFYGCSRLTLNADDTPDLSIVSDLSQMFRNAASFVDTKDNIGTWNVSTVTNMSNMFRSAFDFNENIGLWNVGNVTNFSFMFSTTFFNQNVNNWNIGENVTGTINMNSMFDSTSAFNQPLNDWDVSKVINMAGMFGVTQQFNQPLNNWDTKNVLNMVGMFFGANKFDQNLGDWNLSSITNMSNMFQQSGLSTENYDATLIGWATLDETETQIPATINFSAGNSSYCFAIDARNTLTTAPYNWTISDGGTTCTTTDFFVTTWQTTTDNESITIPTISSSTYRYSVDWGDGTIESSFTGNATHQYATAGTHTVKITGDFPRIVFRNASNKAKIVTIEQWGTQQWTSMSSAFRGCLNLKLNADDIPDLSQVTKMSSMFRDCTNFEDLKDTMNSWDMTTVESISYMFSNCILFDENIKDWTFTKLESSYSTFNGATAFNQDISNWNMSTVEDMESMFKDATSFNQPVGNWTLGVVDYINDFFAGATSFNQDLSNWDFSNVYAAYDMFNGATSFDQDLSAWDISNVESLDDFFVGSGMSQENYDNTLIGWATLAAGETVIPVNLTLNADVPHCLSVDAVNTLTSAPYNWTINDLGNSCPGDAFITTWQITAANEYVRIPTRFGVSYNFSVDWGDGTVSQNLTDTANHEYATAGTYTVKIYGDFPQPYFDNANQAKPRLQTIEQWGTQQWISMVSGFEDCPNLKLNADDVPDLSQLTSLEDMFRKCTNFEDLKDMMGSWDVSGVERIDDMFAYCTLFNEDISGWSFDHLKDSSYTFQYATTFNQDISNWDVSNVENFESMFEGAAAFDQPIGTWTIGTVEYMISMFEDATEFNQDLSTWDISRVLEIGDMFKGASTFDQSLGDWDISNVTYIEDIFVGTAVSQENYDNTLIGWATLDAGETQIPTNIEFSADATYCLGEDARNILTSAPYNWTISDGGLGCIAPVITLLGDNPQVIELGDAYTELGAEVTYGATLTINSSAVNTNEIDTYIVTYTAVNPVSGISATEVTRTAEVIDTTGPTVSCQNITVQLDETGNASIEASALDNGATDLSGITSLDIDITAFDCTHIGEHTVTLTVTDTYGNSSMCTAVVTVIDDIIPVFTLAAIPTDIEVMANTNEGYTLSDFAVGLEVTDNCTTTTITQHPIAGTVLDAGKHVITLTATDSSDNTAMITFTITVTETDEVNDLFTLYPNPTIDQVWITGLEGEAELILYDTNGRVLKMVTVVNNQSVSTTDLSEGVYLIHLEQGDTYQTELLIKK